MLSQLIHRRNGRNWNNSLVLLGQQFHNSSLSSYTLPGSRQQFCLFSASLLLQHSAASTHLLIWGKGRGKSQFSLWLCVGLCQFLWVQSLAKLPFQYSQCDAGTIPAYSRGQQFSLLNHFHSHCSMCKLNIGMLIHPLCLNPVQSPSSWFYLDNTTGHFTLGSCLKYLLEGAKPELVAVESGVCVEGEETTLTDPVG